MVSSCLWNNCRDFGMTLCIFRVRQVLPAKVEGKGSLGSKVKKWVQITYLAVSDLHPKWSFVGLKNPYFQREMMALKALKDQLDPQAHQAHQDWWYTHVIFLHIIYTGPIPTYLWTICCIAHSLCLQWKGPPGIEGLDGKSGKPGLRVSYTHRSHTQAEYPNTHWSDPIVSILHSQGSLYSAVKFCCFQGLRGDSVLDVIVIRSLKKLDNEEMKLLALSKG